MKLLIIHIWSIAINHMNNRIWREIFQKKYTEYKFPVLFSFLFSFFFLFFVCFCALMTERATELMICISHILICIQIEWVDFCAWPILVIGLCNKQLFNKLMIFVDNVNFYGATTGKNQLINDMYDKYICAIRRNLQQNAQFNGILRFYLFVRSLSNLIWWQTYQYMNLVIIV